MMRLLRFASYLVPQGFLCPTVRVARLGAAHEDADGAQKYDRTVVA